MNNNNGFNTAQLVQGWSRCGLLLSNRVLTHCCCIANRWLFDQLTTESTVSTCAGVRHCICCMSDKSHLIISIHSMFISIQSSWSGVTGMVNKHPVNSLVGVVIVCHISTHDVDSDLQMFDKPQV